MKYDYNIFSDYKSLLDISLLKIIPIDFIINNRIVPLFIEDGKIHIVLEQANNIELLNRLKLIYRKDVNPIIADKELFDEMLQYVSDLFQIEFALDSLNSNNDIFSTKELFNKSINDVIQNSPVVRLVDYLINNGIKSSASDIHMEPEENGVRIRYRIDGTLVFIKTLPISIYSNLITRIKVLGSMDISEKKIPQDGKVQHKFNNKTYDLRISSLPTLYGEKIVIRILDKSIDFCEIGKIYLDSEEKESVSRLLMNNCGIILITGPTGSGKSTSIYAMIKKLNSLGINITTIEDPVEYTMAGINQVNVNTKAGINFASGLRSILRQDPDVIMIGEIRDEETAAIAIRAAITGHLVLATLHTNDAKGAVNRLINMGVEEYLIQDALVGVISQRLVKKICSKCKVSYKAPKKSSVLKDKNINILFKGNGCRHCNDTGYSGRVAVSEILYLEKQVDENRFEYQYKSRLFDSCLKLVKEGITTIEEYIKITTNKTVFEGEDDEKVSV